MELLLDTANSEQIQKYVKILPISGVTTNPSILKREGRIDFFERLNHIREIIGPSRTLHIQVTDPSAEAMIEEAHTLLDKIDTSIHIKIPVTSEGLKAIQELKKQEIKITATAIYTKIQGFLAIAAGADYIAPYYNRMEALGLNAQDVFQSLCHEINRTNSSSKLLGASYKTIEQLTRTVEVGAHAVTIDPDIIDQVLSSYPITQAVKDFQSDWQDIYGNKTISDLVD